MNENNPNASAKSRGWMESFSHFLTGEPRDKDDLLDSLREMQVKNLIGMETLSMIEGGFTGFGNARQRYYDPSYSDGCGSQRSRFSNYFSVGY